MTLILSVWSFLFQVILICFLQGKTWEEYCTKIAETLGPNIEGYAAALSNRIGDDIQEGDDDAFMKEKAKSGDNMESVSKTKHNSKMEEDGKTGAEEKLEQDDHLPDNIIDGVAQVFLRNLDDLDL